MEKKHFDINDIYFHDRLIIDTDIIVLGPVNRPANRFARTKQTRGSRRALAEYNVRTKKTRPTWDALFPQLLGSTFSPPPDSRSTVGSMTLRWQMGVHSGDYQVTSSVVINSGGTVLDVINYGLYVNFTYDCGELSDAGLPDDGRAAAVKNRELDNYGMVALILSVNLVLKSFASFQRM